MTFIFLMNKQYNKDVVNGGRQLTLMKLQKARSKGPAPFNVLNLILSIMSPYNKPSPFTP